jgi:XTP/dITP diphosphohydrolase
MMKLVFATNNQHKLNEVRRMLGERFNVLGLSDIGCNEDIPETADTLEGNASIKSRYVS